MYSQSSNPSPDLVAQTILEKNPKADAVYFYPTDLDRRTPSAEDFEKVFQCVSRVKEIPGTQV